jgi:hypothetical protein
MNASISTPRPSSFTVGCGSRAGEVALSEGQLYRWTGNQVGLLIEAREGAAWLTQNGDIRDIILSRGQSFRITHRGSVVVQSLTPIARLAVCRDN